MKQIPLMVTWNAIALDCEQVSEKLSDIHAAKRLVTVECEDGRVKLVFEEGSITIGKDTGILSIP